MDLRNLEQQKIKFNQNRNPAPTYPLQILNNKNNTSNNFTSNPAKLSKILNGLELKYLIKKSAFLRYLYLT
jgi:hypothetical protein